MVSSGQEAYILDFESVSKERAFHLFELGHPAFDVESLQLDSEKISAYENAMRKIDPVRLDLISMA